MKTTSNALQFCEPTSVAEEKRFQEDIVAQTNNKFEYFLVLVILLHFKPKNSVNLLSSDEKFKLEKTIPARGG